MGFTIRKAETYKEFLDFIKLPYRLYRDNPYWVPLPLMEMKKRFNPSKHPYFEHATAEMFIAYENGNPVGRIIAHRNELHEWYYHDKTGFFGFFESIDSKEVAHALLEQAATWLRHQGLVRMRGPMNFSTNEECGLLIEGFERLPSILMPYNPPYYADLLESFGAEKAMDLLAWEINRDTIQLDVFYTMADKIRQKFGARIQLETLSVQKILEDRDTIRVLYNDAWSENWSFVPMTRREFIHMAKELKPLADPDLLILARYDGQPAGFILSIPDINRVLHKIRGKLFPFGWLRFLRGLRKLKRFRVLTLGIRKDLRYRGLDVLLIHETIQRGKIKEYEEAELSWILETNVRMNKPLQKLGAFVTKKYRVYDIAL